MPMRGIDIASYQQGIDLSKVPCDFVIVKATEGTGYVNPDCARAVEQALRLGKAVGVYHYVNGTGAIAEADFFFSQCKGWNGRVVWCVDWEAGGNRAWGNTAYLDTLIKRLRSLTGRPPMLYASSAVFPWAVARANDCGTWVAQYASMAATGYQDTPWNEGKYSCAIRQYSSAGRLSGWGGDLDLNKFYGDRADWDKYAGATSAASKVSTASTTSTSTSASAVVDRALDARTGTDGARQLAITGVLGSPTLRRLQEVMGTQIGGPAAPAYAALQRFLDGAMSSGAKRTLTGSTTLAADGVMGWRSWKCLQYWSAHANPSWMRQSGGPADLNGQNFGRWVTGRGDPAAIRMLQHILNSSYKGSGKLLSK